MSSLAVGAETVGVDQMLLLCRWLSLGLFLTEIFSAAVVKVVFNLQLVYSISIRLQKVPDFNLILKRFF